jgi:hypothetical protein
MDDAPLPVWVLTLPHVTRHENHIPGEWKDPDAWPGDWQIWRNKHTAVVVAQTELEARTLVAMKDCGVWMDPTYAYAMRLSTTTPSVILSAGGSAENE